MKNSLRDMVDGKLYGVEQIYAGGPGSGRRPGYGTGSRQYAGAKPVHSGVHAKLLQKGFEYTGNELGDPHGDPHGVRTDPVSRYEHPFDGRLVYVKKSGRIIKIL